jgi:hypothetical protein
MLLLDEPTNHLDAESVAWLEHHLADFPGTIVAITHDRYFLDNVAEWILELDRGEGIPWKGNYSSWLEQKRERLRQEEKSESARQKTLERELDWIRMSPRARHAKGKARINAYEELLSQDEREQVRTSGILGPNWPEPHPRTVDVPPAVNIAPLRPTTVRSCDPSSSTSLSPYGYSRPAPPRTKCPNQSVIGIAAKASSATRKYSTSPIRAGPPTSTLGSIANPERGRSGSSALP